MKKDSINGVEWVKSHKIKAIVTLVIIALLIIMTTIFIQKNNANSQIDQFYNSIKNNNPEKLSYMLSDNDRKMSKNEAENLINYFHSENNQVNLDKGVKEVRNNLKNNKGNSNLGSIKDNNNKDIINFSKNGKHYFIFDKLSMTPKYRTVYVKELDNTATYKFEDNKHAVADKNKLSKVGEFVVGNYEVSAVKQFKKGAVKDQLNGNIHINTEKKNKHNKIVASQDFNQTKIKIHIHNYEKLDNKPKVMINGKIVKYKPDKIYGYFPANDSFSVQADGKLGSTHFKTNKVDVMQGITKNSTQIVNLNFDEKDINKKIKKENKNKKIIGKFIESYNDKLTEAYKEKDYNKISSYIKTSSKAEDFMKPKFKHKQKVEYKNVEVKSVENKDNEYKVSVSKIYKGDVINNKYYIEMKDDKPQIVKIET